MRISKVKSEIRKYEELIEKNPDSPLLVRLASLYLEAGDVEKAITLCNKAIQKYPDYSTAHLLMAKCYIELKAYSKALVELNRVVEILPDSKFVIDLISQISLKQKREETLKGVIKSKVSEEEVEINKDKLPDVEIPEVQIAKSEAYSVSEKVGDEMFDEIFEMPDVEFGEEKSYEVEVETQASYLDELIKRIEIGISKRGTEDRPAKEPVVEFKEEDLSYEDISIVTPTLAEILVKQGAYDEAIKVYKKLIEQRPFEREKYEMEIKKLEEKLGK
ncbi:Tetratricopeptide repeat-containing protein [Candidatus Kryptonium thompsonii]|uniref:Tetratricopeptide repeat-containing protein n=2 Tax=Candidatus Kryptonium thompsonii TaxID=1633631 RepID=A0A0P1LV41_9BACT|nr:tetratricopeptide repeat protein [Candidatus Kryptonium thompsoni]CUS80221.1 Tetratricopeptide repeat-containing protein [Candidatus Kryptonium thompsoni]CUS83407.1 Tetratricopeptide repeat-containing protein [Candidatus Kryptonium thompsoni]CUS86105.1 Tetratricopeptide repeat-containing protein [Candidatus Kryptonium thompsoni]CUS86368.1 Tetratricopeptide repeat-containing protein [Candidatus Kryptonium thompsoni]CUS92364.1 Tetratricopeptide repeat-containing protein [Candidatus Kryptonium